MHNNNLGSGASPQRPKEARHKDSIPRKEKRTVLVANQDIRKYVDRMRKPGPRDGWLAYPEIPTSEEIMGLTTEVDQEDGFINLAANQVVAPWISTEAYLRTHYELLREDSVALLRDCVAHIKNKPSMNDTNEICIYEQVYIRGITFALRGAGIKVSFSTARAQKNIVWDYSSRLIAGSMVALSPAKDCFKTQCVIAVVAARPVEQVKQLPHQVDLFFANPDDAQFDTQKEWIMVQPRSGYLESVRHTMRALQLMNEERFPLSEHICNLRSEIDTPEYVHSSPEMKLLHDKTVDVLSSWPQEPENNLDESQWEALRHVLTKRLAIIQGPPGTGKTHVSVAALKLLLENRKRGDPPIIVAAYTNHALDQLLNHIAHVVPDYIRLGGRSLDENVKKRTLWEVRKSIITPPLVNGAMLPAKRKQQAVVESLINLLRPFLTENSSEPLPASFFHEQKVLTDRQYETLCNGARGWIDSDLEEHPDPMTNWVGDKLVEHTVAYGYDDLGFEDDEMDLEYEQLKEMEQEKGLVDDDSEALQGYFLSLREGFRGQSTIDEELVTELDIDDFWNVPVENRGTVYNSLQYLAKRKVLSVYREYMRQYSAFATEYLIGKWEKDYVFLKDAKLIGMTITGLSKYRALVSALKPRIVMIEEAAEAIEAPVAAACVESLEHLILVGDHKQLQGSCSVTDLEGEPFFLNVSMFERLVQNNVDFRVLRHQRRMAPEIRRLLTPIYDNLEDHPSVHELSKVPAMGDIRAFLFCHDWPESSDSLFSKYNNDEAYMVVAFFLHLVFSGVDPGNITVLTFYNGQRKKILKLLREIQHLQGKYLKVSTVDSYQGEENDIVLLSLVRSSEGGGIGFLSIENRVCVALSRARRGFYIFGNAQKLASTDPLWWEVVKILGGQAEESRRIGYHLPLICDNHGNKEFVKTPEEIRALNGGCHLPCKESLQCGHPCPLKCHGFDHAKIHCSKTCAKPLPCGHNCRESCSAQTCSSPLTRNALVRAFQDFAKGGAKERDREMLERHNAAQARADTLARQDTDESVNLFADRSPTRDLDVRVVSDGQGGSRTRWVQSYSPPVPSLQEGAEAEMNLIEFD
ncbi:putative DEAD box helicase [Talaromyces proteolyticus]|uniref:DEAD box helicase n=1 Tax=Talaromyces proteolyticus TaxID=1131652 RepID=A0AAD4PYQ7_9EURO|nr:putative DEAD box helicase [Talaromyces proteolyticus]KAH8701780.1 putative DEAD box helicase [Talaromyces proteolyticus]